MKNLSKFSVIIILTLLTFSMTACDNGTTNNSDNGMDQVLRVDKEVRDLFFYSSNGRTRDFPLDTGRIAAVCTDYALEFYYRYQGEVYLVAISYGGGPAIWYTVEQWLPANTFNWRTREQFGLNSVLRNGVWEYDGVIRDATKTVVGTEIWSESTYRNIQGHMWNVVVIDGKWYLVDSTWRDNNLARNPIKEIIPPSFAR